MVRVRLREDGPRQYRNRSGVSVDEDAPEVDVDPDQAAYLVEETGYFEFVETDPRLEGSTVTSETADDGGAGDDQQYQFDPDTWFDDHDGYTAREERVLSGDVDDHLETIAEIERSDNVLEAIDARRAALEE